MRDKRLKNKDQDKNLKKGNNYYNKYKKHKKQIVKKVKVFQFKTL